jgi:hypothetical protein
MGQYTKGPWESIDAQHDTMIGNFAYASHLITTVDQMIHEGSSRLDIAAVTWIEDQVFDKIGKSEANARLLAAAPDLLEALQDCLLEFQERYDLESSSTNPGIRFAAEAARAAIAKATT